jgi:hypothetical protein
MAELDDLLGLLAAGARWPLERHDLGVAYIDERDDRFIAPPLDLSEDHSDAAAVMVSASAAVGKTMLAKEIAARTQSSYWDLSRFRVGNNFLPGTIGKVFGFDQTGPAIASLRAGRATVVLDALDETQVSSGEANFLAFLTDLGELLAELSPPRPVLAMFARDDTADYAVEFLRSAGARVATTRILYFEEERAHRFVDQALRLMSDASSDEFHQRYTEAKEGVFQLLARSLGTKTPWDDPAARSFMGYAPVLGAIAEYLHTVENGRYGEALRHLGSDVADHSLWSFLERIVLAILDREKVKLAESYEQLLGQPLDEDYYSPEEQIHLLLVDKIGTGIRPPVTLDAEQQARAVAAVQQKLDVHPFLSSLHLPAGKRFVNAVFRDYALASALSDHDASRAMAAVDETRPDEFQPTPMLGFFVLHAAAKDDTAVDAERFPPVYESLVARREGFRFEISEGDQPGEAIVVLRLTDEERAGVLAEGRRREGEEDVLARFRLTGWRGKPLVFRRWVTDVVLDLPKGAVEIGDQKIAAQIGPGVDLACDVLRIVTREVTLASHEDQPVILSAGSLDDRVSAKPPAIRGANSAIIVDVPRAKYPWDQFAPVPDGTSGEYARLAQACGELRQLVRWFKAGIGSGLTYHRKTLETLAARRRISADLLDFGRETGLITAKGHYYTLDPDVAGINVTEVRLLKVSPALATYLREYISWRSRHQKR